MSNPGGPPGYVAPSSAQLLRSTLIALVVAAAILVAFVLPSEYGVDPTGVGTALGLTRMGEIKMQLASEAEAELEAEAGAEAEEAMASADAVAASEPEATEPASAVIAPADPVPSAEPATEIDDDWRDETVVLVAPDEAAELKLVMKAGEQAEYSWTAEGGALNFNAHGHGGGQSITYEKGRGAQEGKGTLAAPFDGHHGWFWRNRSRETVSLTLRTRGQYSELTQTR